MRNNIIETVMGAVVIAVAVFFLVFAYTSSGMKQNSGHVYSANFDRVDGLVIGSDVKMSGVKVGIVQSLKIDPKTYMANAVFSVDRTIKLPKDTSAEIIGSGLMGDKYLAIVPGGDDATLNSGDTITHTQSAVSLEGMIGQLIFSAKNKDKDDPAKQDASDPKTNHNK